MDIETVRKTILHDAPGITKGLLQRWNDMTAREPWWTTDHVDSDHLVELIRMTARAALTQPVTQDDAAGFVETALAHGRDRRSDGHRDTVIHQEFVLLRRALRADLRERIGGEPAVHEAISRLDGALNHAEIASLHGYHEHDLPDDSARNAPARLTQEWVDRCEDWPAGEASGAG